MRRYFLLIALVCAVAFAANAVSSFEFPKWFVVIMNIIVVPLVCQVVKKITPIREIRAIIAAVLSFITAIIAILITGAGNFNNLPGLIILAYTVSQLAYNLFWHRLLEGNKS